ncbi:methionine adenosyltransferase [Thiosocius teredinicola]|uniref:methionine adenosyltransferase n=1 Tax=Thiosocius teredinicola TaxID=1973002 RepID=UPI000990CD07
MNTPFLFTSESVTAGHPDKLCDQISDAIVDAYLTGDPGSRIIAEAAVSGGVLFLSARANSSTNVDLTGVAREIVAEAGYREGEFNADDCTVMLSQYALPNERHPRIDVRDLENGDVDDVVASQPATVFGYACDETPSLMPLPISLAHLLARALDSAVCAGQLESLGRDAKVQVGVEYADRAPRRIHSITFLTAQRTAEQPTPAQLRELLTDKVLVCLHDQALKQDDDTQLYINPEGVLIGGGPVVHAGLTGRKNAIDTYGEYSRHSGAALSGKDPLRIDRSGAYAARHAAKQVVAARLARHCEVQISYTVGRASPASVRVHTYGTGVVDDAEISRRLSEVLDFRPAAIAKRFDLQRLPLHRPGFYRALAVYGHMGRIDLDAPWERVDVADSIA